ncbi:Chromosome partitioning protein parA [Roseomonas mucosa]|uniref:Flp pilus assembly protein, ATPase CpaE n=1 Tax=Roseomonas mucosa TaxID=207340 RepID=A0A1S8D4L6_9PROT|nr:MULTISPECIES: ParA family protein [Roseomonas]MBS5902599.1 ParA family protein [Acetobacteraceae bacterium]ATR21536.1 ParA family protein [Roseomonas sp. FDAARGOS_362]AWV21831.1 Chromosome partitioning protein parA [Roseomonas mucosa]MCG7351308.1 ParA family protein [Roseomonas mucosa]MCG7357714.1 ParA family protein [Roseomonas mucosa]
MLVVGCVSQKGGVAKSSLARLLARELAAQGRSVLLADLDVLQATSVEWARRRAASGRKPVVRAECFDGLEPALRAARRDLADCLVLDARGFADAQTLELAHAADALLIPSGLAVDDLLPTVRLAHELLGQGIPAERIAIALCRAGDSASEIEEAALYVREAGYHCLPHAWPEKAGYRRAHDEGRAATEVTHASLRHKAEAFARDAVAFVTSRAPAGPPPEAKQKPQAKQKPGAKQKH